MKVELEKLFPMPASADVAWEFLQDIEAVAACMPGAKITERLADGALQGNGHGPGRPGDHVFPGRCRGARCRCARRIRCVFSARVPTAPAARALRSISAARVEAVAGGLEQSGRQERSDDERQGGGVRRTHDDTRSPTRS